MYLLSIPCNNVYPSFIPCNNELESIKSEENPYSTERMNLSLENLIESRSIKSEDLNSIKSEDLTKDTEKDFIKRKYKILKEKFGEEIEHTIVNYSKRLCERTIEYLEKKKILTKEERETLNFLKGRFDKIEESTTWREHTINEIYEGILLEEKENNKRERYNEKKRKYDRIKNKIGDEIDEELIKARERLRENIIQRIRYFEEKKMLTVREAQELEDLKRPGKLDEEELLIEEYVINDIYEGLTEKEKEDKIDVKEKGKETEKSSKLELEKDEEYTIDTVGELGRFLEETLREIEKEEKEKKFGLDDEEVRTWAENIEIENEETLENIIIDDEKIINTPEISSSSESSSDSDKESEIVEILEEFELYFGNQDLNLENLFEENTENIEMALNIMKPSFFSGGPDEDPSEWVKEFDRAAEANAWINDDADDNLRTRMAKAHLKGEAADWCDDNNATLTRQHSNGDAANQLAELIVTRFNTGQRKLQWLQKFDEVRQRQGESLEEFNKRFDKITRRVGADVTDVGKAAGYTRALLPAIKQFALLGNQGTVAEAKESARRAEISAFGFARQLIPEETLENNKSNETVYEKVKKEKTEKDMEDLMKKFEKLEVKLMNQMGNNRGNYQRNYQGNNRGNYQGNNYIRRDNRENNNIICYNCNKTGHIRPNCPEGRNNNDNNRRNNNGNNNRNYNNERNNERNVRYLNFNSTFDEDRNVRNYESSDNEDDNEYNCNFIEIEKSEDEDNEYELYPVPVRKQPNREVKSREKVNKHQLESKRERELLANRNRKLIDEDSDSEMSDIQDNPRMSMPENTSNNTQNKVGKMTRTEALQKAYQVRERKFKCRNCDNIGHFTTNCPTLPIKEKEKIMKVRERNKERKQKSFPINLEKRIKDLPCGLTIEEAFKMIPGYKKEFGKTIKIVKKGEKVNYMGTPEKSRFTSMKSKAEIEDVEIDAIIDTGAAISAMTRSLMEELGYKINRSSDVVIVTADGTKSRSLGKIVDMELTLNGVDTIVTVQVIESKDRTLILGNDWLKKVKAQIDMDKGKINIKGKKGFIDIPVDFFVMKDEMNEEYEEEYEDEELREEKL